MITVQWLPKSQDSLPSTKPHSSSQNNIRRVASSQVWAVKLLPESFWDQNGHRSWVFLSHFSIFHASWVLPIVFELLCRSLLREQCQNPWFQVEWRVEMSCKCWSNLKNGRPAALVTFERMEATIPLFISENKTWLGFSCSSYRAHPLSASVSDFMDPRTGCLQLFKCWADQYLGSSCFSQSTQ